MLPRLQTLLSVLFALYLATPLALHARAEPAQPAPSPTPPPADPYPETSPSTENPPLPTDQRTLPAEALRLLSSGNAALQAGDFAAAAELYRQARILAPDWLPLLINSALAELRCNRADSARQLLEQALRSDFASARSWLTLGIVFLEKNEPLRALASFAQAAAIEPQNPQALNFLGVAAASLGWFDAAEDSFRQALRIKPEFADAHFNLANCELHRPKPDLAIARHHYQLALRHGAKPDPEVEKKLATKKP